MSIEIPKPAIISTETNRNEPAGIPLNWTIVDKNKVKNVKLAMNPATTPTRRERLVLSVPIEVESTIGKMGRMQGDKIVTIPARKAKPRSNIIGLFNVC